MAQQSMLNDEIQIPEPTGFGTLRVEPFADYFRRWPREYAQVPQLVVETWVHRHWSAFQHWLPLRPLDWKYALRRFSLADVLQIDHVGDWPDKLLAWGDELFEGTQRHKTWLGRFMLETGTTPAPIIVAEGAGRYGHPRELNLPLREPLQLIEGHARLAYLRAMVRHGHPALQATHQVFVATLPA